MRVTLLSTPFCLVLTFRTRLPAHSLSCASNSKESPCFAFDLWVGKIPWRTTWQPTPVFLPGESYGWRSLIGYSPWGRKELDTTERLHFLSFTLSPMMGNEDEEQTWRHRREHFVETVTQGIMLISLIAQSVKSLPAMQGTWV